MNVCPLNFVGATPATITLCHRVHHPTPTPLEGRAYADQIHAWLLNFVGMATIATIPLW